MMNGGKDEWRNGWKRRWVERRWVEKKMGGGEDEWRRRWVEEKMGGEKDRRREKTAKNETSVKRKKLAKK